MKLIMCERDQFFYKKKFKEETDDLGELIKNFDKEIVF